MKTLFTNVLCIKIVLHLQIVFIIKLRSLCKISFLGGKISYDIWRSAAFWKNKNNGKNSGIFKILTFYSSFSLGLMNILVCGGGGIIQGIWWTQSHWSKKYSAKQPILLYRNAYLMNILSCDVLRSPLKNWKLDLCFYFELVHDAELQHGCSLLELQK